MNHLNDMRLLSFAAKLFGLAPFCLRFGEKGKMASCSKLSTAYAIVAAILANIAFFWSLNDYFEAPSQFKYDKTLSTIFMFESLMSLIRNLTVYLVLLINQWKMINSINSMQRTHNELQRFVHFETFIDNHCGKTLQWRKRVTVIQVMISCLCVFFNSQYAWNYSWKKFVRMGTLLCFSNGISIVLGPMHFAAGISMLQMFRLVNIYLGESIQAITNITQLDSRTRMRMQLYCDASDEMDRIARMYKQVSMCSKEFCKAFSWSILIELLNSSVCTLTGVSIFCCGITSYNNIVYCFIVILPLLVHLQMVAR